MLLCSPAANLRCSIQSTQLAEDALQIFEQGASAAPEPHAPLLQAWAALARRLGRDELAADVEQQLEAQLHPSQPA